MNARNRWILWLVAAVVAILAIVGFVALRGLWADRIPEGAVVVPRDAATLEDALADASPGSVIVIQGAQAPLQGPIRITTDHITLSAIGERVELNGIGAEPALTIAADGVSVQGFDVMSESVGVRVQASDCRLSDLDIRDTPIAVQVAAAARCELHAITIAGGDIGLDIAESRNIDVRSVAISGASQYGIRLRGVRTGVLEDVELDGNDVAIALEDGSTDNLIVACVIRNSTVAGIEIRGSNDNTVRETTLRGCRVGVLLDGVTGIGIEQCVAEGSGLSGIMLQQAIQNRVVETRIDESGANGIQLSQSHENSLLHNHIRDSAENGIYVVASGKNLILGNRIERCAVGLIADGCDDLRILRNEVISSTMCGMLVSESQSGRVFDNEFVGGRFGVVLTACEGTKVLRNTIASAATAALSSIDSWGGNQLTENVVRRSGWGALIAGSAQDLWAYNVISANDVGCWLAGIGDGLRIEGNTFANNGIALGFRSNGAWLNDALNGLDLSVSTDGEASLPLLANNVFLGSAEADIRNEGTVTLLAAGNWWGSDVDRDPSLAKTFGSVALDVSAWKGTIAVGSGTDDVSLVLGRILQQVLEGAGYRVIDLIGLGVSDRLRQALLDEDVDLIWWDGIAAEDPTLPALGAAASVVSTRASNGWRIVVSAQLAEQLAESTVSGLASWTQATGGLLRFTSTTSLHDEAFDAFAAAYALRDSVRSFTPAESLSEVEALLKFGAVDVAIVRSLEETLTLSGFIALSDDRDALEQREISMIVKSSIVDEFPEVLNVLDSLGERLTERVLHDLVSRVRLLRKEPADVARGFLTSEDD